MLRRSTTRIAAFGGKKKANTASTRAPSSFPKASPQSTSSKRPGNNSHHHTTTPIAEKKGLFDTKMWVKPQQEILAQREKEAKEQALKEKLQREGKWDEKNSVPLLTRIESSARAFREGAESVYRQASFAFAKTSYDMRNVGEPKLHKAFKILQDGESGQGKLLTQDGEFLLVEKHLMQPSRRGTKYAMAMANVAGLQNEGTESEAFVRSENKSARMEYVEMQNESFGVASKTLVTDETSKALIDKADLQNQRIIGFLFAAQWDAQSKQFLPQILSAYSVLRQKAYDFEVVYVPGDLDEAQYKSFTPQMPWMRLPFRDPRAKQLSNLFKVKRYPRLVLVRAKDGQVLTTDACDALSKDRTGDKYPWIDNKTFWMKRGIRGLVTIACCVWFYHGFWKPNWRALTRLKKDIPGMVA